MTDLAHNCRLLSMLVGKLLATLTVKMGEEAQWTLAGLLSLSSGPSLQKGIAHSGLVQLTIKTHPSTFLQVNLTQIIPHSRLFRLCQMLPSSTCAYHKKPSFQRRLTFRPRHRLGTATDWEPTLAGHHRSKHSSLPYLGHGHHPQRIPPACPFYRCKVKATGEGNTVFISKITASSVSTWGHLVKG